MVKLIKEDEEIDYQVVALGDHCLLLALRAIGTFKNHFTVILSGIDTNFPKQACQHILEYVVITLNMLCLSKLNLIISAYM